MAALSRRKEATYEVHETIKVDTQDNEDHTFCGIMFPVKCKNILPLNHIAIRSVSVRGQLGPLTVWISNNERRSSRHADNHNNADAAGGNNRNSTSFRLSRDNWTKIYERVHAPSLHTYQTLHLDEPIIMKPGEVRAIYIHSTLPGDEAIVYDNAYYYYPRRAAAGGYPGFDDGHRTPKPRYDDSMISIYTGRSHVSNTPFGSMPIWGWGNAWRDHREFVGQLEYGAVYRLWNPEPETRLSFGPNFTKSVITIFACQRKWESPISMLPDECLFYILNMCRWDWFLDTKEAMKKKHCKKLRQIRMEQRELRRQQQEQQLQQLNDTNTDTNTNETNSDNNNNSNEDTNERQQHQGVALRDAYINDAEDDDPDDEDYVEYEELHDADDDDAFFADDDDANVETDADNDEVMVSSDDEDDGVFHNDVVSDHQVFRFVDVDSEEENENNNNNSDDQYYGEEQQGQQQHRHLLRGEWLRRQFASQFARIHILRAIINDNGDENENDNGNIDDNNNNEGIEAQEQAEVLVVDNVD